MNRSACLFSTLLFAVALFGCAPDDMPEPEGDMVPDTTAHTLAFAGDYEGPLGLQLWSLRDYTAGDVAGALTEAHDMGFREVELAGTYGMSVDSFLQMLNAADLKATSMHTGYDRFRDSLEVVLDEAEALGVDYVGLAWIPHEGTFTEATALETAALFNTWGAAAQARGLQFFYHTHGYEFQTDSAAATPFDALVAATDADAVKFEMDVFWVAHSGTDPVALLQQYPDRWALMHVKDMKEGTTFDHTGHATAEANVPVGTGLIDYAAVLAAGKEIGLARYYIEDESTDPLANIPQSIAFLESVTF